ncbi:MAG: hypothetical protein R3C03_06160 [Pirellulaceae bacterium]
MGTILTDTLGEYSSRAISAAVWDERADFGSRTTDDGTPRHVCTCPFRQTGAMLFNNTSDERTTWAVSGFRTISDNFGNVYGDDGGYGTAERFTRLLRDGGDCQLFHVGLDHSYLDPARNQMQIASQDEIFVGQNPNFGPTGLSVLPIVNVPPYVNSGVFNVNTANLFNVEAAYSWGRGLIQSECRWTNLSLPGGGDRTINAGYITRVTC